EGHEPCGERVAGAGAIRRMPTRAGGGRREPHDQARPPTSHERPLRAWHRLAPAQRPGNLTLAQGDGTMPACAGQPSRIGSRRSGRDPSTVSIVAVTKTFPPAVVTAALAAGLEDVGENYVQEARAKRRT